MRIKGEAIAAIRTAARRGPPDILGEALGVDAAVVRGTGIGLVSAGFHEDFWEPEEAGQTAVTVPVLEDAVVVDIVVFRLDAPNRWWVRSGYGKALGLDAADQVRAATPIWKLPNDPAPPPLPTYSTPLSWLRNGAAGAMILHEKWADYVLGGIDAVVAEDRDHAHDLHAALPKRSLPKILLREERAAA